MTQSLPQKVDVEVESTQTINTTMKAPEIKSVVKSHTLTSAQIPALVQKLEAQLPYSIPLLRRIQFALRHPVTPTARIFIAAIVPLEHPVGNEDEKSWDVDAWLSHPHLPSESDATPWLAAHIDLGNPGQTQVWLFASWEASPTYPLPSSQPDSLATLSAIATQLSVRTHVSLIRSLFNYIHADLIPLAPETPPEEWRTLERTGKYLSTPYSRDNVLFGTVGEKIWGLFPRGSRTRTDENYWKILFRVPVTSSAGAEAARNGGGNGGATGAITLLKGYHFGPMRDQHLQAVVDRTPVPRTLATLRQLVSVGIYHESSETPIGWGFLGKESSLVSMHTEPEHRGKGLAVALGAELLRRGQIETSFTSEGRDCDGQSFTWGHADVSKTNTASLRVMEKLGGEPMWMIMWTEVNIREVLLETQ